MTVWYIVGNPRIVVILLCVVHAPVVTLLHPWV